MSCNGCRVLRKGCSDTCILRPCLQWIESSEAQGYATVFVAKFFGRAGLMGFISAVPEIQRPALFRSLLYEACGRTVNPVFGSVGLLWTGDWQICQAAVDTVLGGGILRPQSPSSLVSTVPANRGSSRPYPPAFAMSGSLSVPLGGRVDDPTTRADYDSFDRQTMSLGIGLPDAKGQELQERSTNVCFRDSVEPSSNWQKDGQGDSGIQFHTNTEIRKVRRGQEGYEFQHLGVQFQGAYMAPRRVRARVESSLVPPVGSGELPMIRNHRDQEGEVLELDLTLQVKGGFKGEKTVGTKRLSSPCESLNSEGSVTSLDSTLREPVRPVLVPASTMGLVAPHLRKLLPLLQ